MESWAGETQELMERAVVAAERQDFTERLWALLSDQVLIIIALAVVGMLVGIATTTAIKIAWRAFRPEPVSAGDRQRRVLQYRVFGMGAGLLWTFALEWSVLTGAATFAVASAVAIIAGGFTPAAYDLFWNRVVPLLGRWLGRKSGGPPGGHDDDSGDRTRTSFRP